MNIKKTLVPAAVLASATCIAATPQVTSVTMTQSTTSRLVTIDYTFTGADAVITLDVQTNAPGGAWASIGGAAVCNAQGEVWKKVTNNGSTHHITWRPDLSWPDHVIADGGARAVVTAWTLDNTPDYMVVDLSAAAQPNTQAYYPSADFIPGGIFGRDEYRTTMLVMRKIMAKDVTWTMGSTSLETKRTESREATHQVTLTNNYYIGVFPITQTQWSMVGPYRPEPATFNNPTDRSMRPVECVCYNEIRNSQNKNADATCDWPADPNSDSFLGKLRTKTGIDFDLPSEAQWEFAARAGNGSTKWGDGSGIQNQDMDENLALFGRYDKNGGKLNSTNPSNSCGATNATAIVGSYLPNSWGIYDMAGNVWEWCLDWSEDDITANGGAVNIDPAHPDKTLSGAAGANRVMRGGAWSTNASYCRPAYRMTPYPPDSRYFDIGLRVVCTAGLR